MILTAFMAVAMSAAPASGYLCNYSKIRSGARSVAVHASYDGKSRILTTIATGTVVYVCDEYRNNDRTNQWVQVHFADATHPCSKAAVGLEVRRAARCRSGWVRERLVDIISG